MTRRILALVLAQALLLVVGTSRAHAEADPCALDAGWLALGGGAGPRAGDGVGGTGLIDLGDGVGGTGWIEAGDGVGGTGVFGTITGFGSICVNGERIHYDDTAPVELDGLHTGIDALAVGQVVWVVARAEDGELEAERIVIAPSLAGEVESVDLKARRIVVAGRSVDVPATGLLVGASGEPLADLAALRAGDWVAVSALEDAEGTLVASRLEVGGAGGASAASLGALLAEAPALTRLSVEGFVAEQNAAGQVRVGDLWVDVPPGAVLERNERVWLRGRVDRERTLRPERILVRPLRDRAARTPASLRPARSLASEPVASDLVRPASHRAGKPSDAPVRLERVQRIDRVERIERVDRPPRVERAVVVRPLRPERLVRPERPARPDVKRPDRLVRPERVQRPDIAPRHRVRRR